MALGQYRVQLYHSSLWLLQLNHSIAGQPVQFLLSGSSREISTLLFRSWTAGSALLISRFSCHSSFPYPEKTTLYCERQSSFMKTLLSRAFQSMASIFYLLMDSSCRCSLALKPRMELHCTSNKRELDAVLFLVLWFRYLESFLPRGLTWLFIHNQSHWCFLQVIQLVLSIQGFYCLSAIKVTVDPLSRWNVSSFPLKSSVAKTWLGLAAEATKLSC